MGDNLVITIYICDDESVRIEKVHSLITDRFNNKLKTVQHFFDNAESLLRAITDKAERDAPNKGPKPAGQYRGHYVF